MRNFLFFAGEGKVKKRDPDEQGDQALCLNLLTEAVITWNTVYYQKVLDELAREGYPLRDEDVAHLWPTRYRERSSPRSSSWRRACSSSGSADISRSTRSSWAGTTSSKSRRPSSVR